MPSFVVNLPLFCLVDDVTYLHVEVPVLWLQSAAGGSLWEGMKTEQYWCMFTLILHNRETFNRSQGQEWFDHFLFNLLGLNTVQNDKSEVFFLAINQFQSKNGKKMHQRQAQQEQQH